MIREILGPRKYLNIQDDSELNNMHPCKASLRQRALFRSTDHEVDCLCLVMLACGLSAVERILVSPQEQGVQMIQTILCAFL